MNTERFLDDGKGTLPGRVSMVVGLLIMNAFLGCGWWKGAPLVPPEPVDARQTLQMALETWREGESAEQLREEKPPIYMADEQWLFGGQLREFEILGEGELQGTHVRFRVRLEVTEGNRSTPSRKEVTYLVTSGSVWSITRDDS